MTFIGTAAWSISKPSAERFPQEGSSLTRYAAVLDGVEINSSFYKRHKPGTWRRWAESVPDHFRFSVKVPKKISHELRLINAAPVFDEFLKDVSPLGGKLGPLLLQLPPNLGFDRVVVAAFLDHVRSAFDGRIVIEPRHPTWAMPEAHSLLADYRVSRVLADPAVIPPPKAESEDFLYIRLHGAPKIYYSKYQPHEIKTYASMLSVVAEGSWCIFDNTASGAALVNALEMRDLIPPKKGNAPARGGCV